jgi:hypothetical protein
MGYDEEDEGDNWQGGNDQGGARRGTISDLEHSEPSGNSGNSEDSEDSKVLSDTPIPASLPAERISEHAPRHEEGDDKLNNISQTIGTGGWIKQEIIQDAAPERWEKLPFQTVRIYIVDPKRFEADLGIELNAGILAPSGIGAGNIGLPATYAPIFFRNPAAPDPPLPSYAELVPRTPLPPHDDASLNPENILLSLFTAHPPQGVAPEEEAGGCTASTMEPEARGIRASSTAPKGVDEDSTDPVVDVFPERSRPLWKRIWCCLAV